MPITRCVSMAGARDYGGQKRLSRLDDERKFDRPFGVLNRLNFSRNRFADSDTFQKLRADWFFH